LHDIQTLSMRTNFEIMRPDAFFVKTEAAAGANSPITNASSDV
jgi:hypothetical protein